MAYERPANNAYGDVETPQYNVPGQVPGVAPKPLVPNRSPIQAAQYGNPYQGVAASYMQQLQAPKYERTNNTRTKDFSYMKDHIDRPDSYQYDRWAREAETANSGRHSYKTGEHEKARARGWAAKQRVREMQRQHGNDYALQMQGMYKGTSAHNIAEGGYEDAQMRQAMQNQGNFAVNDINNTSQRAMDADNNNVLRSGQNVRLQESMMNAALRATAAQNSAATTMYNAERERFKAGELPDGVTPGKLNLDGSPMTALDKLNKRIRGLETFGDSATSLGGTTDQGAQQGPPASGALYSASTPQQHGALPSFAPAPQRRAAAPFAPAPQSGVSGAGAPIATTPGPTTPTPGPTTPTPVLTQAAAGTGGLAGPVDLPTAENYFVGGAPGVAAPTATTVPAVAGGAVAPAVAAAASEGNNYVADATVRPPADSATAAAAPSPVVPPEAIAAATNGGALGGGANGSASPVANTPAAWADIAAMVAASGGAPGGGANSATPAVPNTAAGRAQVIARDVARAERTSTLADQVLTTMNYGNAAIQPGTVDKSGNAVEPTPIDPDRVRDKQFAMDALAAEGNLPNDIRNDPDLLNRIAFRVQVARAEKTNSQHLVPGAGGEVVLDQDRYTMGKAPGFWDNVSGVFKGAAEGAAAGTSNGNEIGPYGALSGLVRGYNRWDQREITSPGGDPFYVDSDAILPQTASAIHAQQQAEQQLAQQYAPYSRFFHSPLQ